MIVEYICDENTREIAGIKCEKITIAVNEDTKEVKVILFLYDKVVASLKVTNILSISNDEYKGALFSDCYEDRKINFHPYDDDDRLCNK